MKSEQIKAAVLLGVMQMMIVGVMAQDSQPGQKMKLPDSQAMVASAYDFNDTVELLTVAIEEQNLMVLKVINAQQMLKMVNMQVQGMKQLLFFHPRYMKKIMQANPMGAIEPPLKIAVMERPDGKVVVKYIKPSYLLGKYEGLSAIGDELDEILATIAVAVRK
ncbi:MAG: DUF302 domain-containing protein [Candidatus Marinimicrobia bacterium]|nr:DUF302 domain-containing protein [Candidatus Neomarinimicrobiota bacterium]